MDNILDGRIKTFFFDESVKEWYQIFGYDIEDNLIYNKALKLGTEEQVAFSGYLKERKEKEEFDEELIYLSTWRLRFK